MTSRWERRRSLWIILLAAIVAGTFPVDGEERLIDSGFEESGPLGGFPFSADWDASWLGESGVVVTGTAARSGSLGAWQFTGESGADWFSALFQDTAAEPGMTYRGAAWLRAAPGQPWVDGSIAHLRVQFFGPPIGELDGTRLLLGSFASPPLANASTDWIRLEVTSRPAPPGAELVRLVCYLEKPRDKQGQSVINVDDCALSVAEAPSMSVSSRVLGIAAVAASTELRIANGGSSDLEWGLAIDPAAPWLSTGAAAGMVAPGQSEEVVVTAARELLDQTKSHAGRLRLTSNAGDDILIDVHVEGSAAGVPSLPCEVKLYGHQLRVRDRMADGSLSAPYHYVIMGAAWSPASIGLDASPLNRRGEFARWAAADLALLRAMNANTVRMFLDPGTGSSGSAVLDQLHRHGMKVLMTVDEQGSANTDNLAAVVTAYRSHPAVLAWLIGNEWNINFHGESFESLAESAIATEEMAQQVKALDPHHPVISILGDIDIEHLSPLTKEQEDEPQEVSTERIVNDLCPSVDAWGLNIYRGSSFGPLFAQWASITNKPMFVSEFGTDAYRIRLLDVLDGAEDEVLQADTNGALWAEISKNLSALEAGNVCLGGTFFSWCDEWWKVKEKHGGALDVQENLGFFGGHPDGFANEEWFGAVTVDRRTRAVYGVLQAAFGAVDPPADLDRDGIPDDWEYGVIDASADDAIASILSITADGDLDADAVTNVQEFRAGTDPLDPASRLAIESIVLTAEGVRIRWIAGAGSRHVVERTTRPDQAASWEEIHSVAPPAPVQGEFLDKDTGGASNRFYRLRTVR